MNISCAVIMTLKGPVKVKECFESYSRVQDGSLNFVFTFVSGSISGSALGETMLPLAEIREDLHILFHVPKN